MIVGSKNGRLRASSQEPVRSPFPNSIIGRVLVPPQADDAKEATENAQVVASTFLLMSGA